jgi:DinB superfamily
MTGTELCKALGSGQNDITAFFGSLSDEVFFAGSDERWSPAHHLGHLTLTYSRLATGFRAKERLADYTQTPKSYEDIRDTYLTKLQTTPPVVLANNPFAIKLDGSSKDAMIAAFAGGSQELREATTSWSETDLDTKGMKHPLLGLMSAREILFFTLYHDQHHLLGVEKLVKG